MMPGSIDSNCETSGGRIFPKGKEAAVVFSIDDCHPARLEDGYDAGGELGKGVLGLLRDLMTSHPQVKCTLFVTADWREITPYVTKKALSKIPWVRNDLYLADRWPKGKMRLDCHPEFVRFIKSLPRTEIASHGLEHMGKGPRIVREFERLNEKECEERLNEISRIFCRIGLSPRGFAPPGWYVTPPLVRSLEKHRYLYLASARDLETPISREAVASGSGIHEVSLILPCYLQRTRLIHLASNWSATSDFERAEKIIEAGGVLSIKAHMIKRLFNYGSLDGLDKPFCDYLGRLFTHLTVRYGNSLWWATMGEVAERTRITLDARPD